MATLAVYSGSSDRRLISSDNTFATARAATNANAGVEAGTGTENFGSTEFFTPTYYIRRSLMEFDTAALTSGAIISAATLAIAGTGVTTDTNNYSMNIFFFTRGSAAGGAFDANDFDEAQGTAACDTPIDITGLSGTKTFALNAAALAAINKTGYTQFSLRLSGDYANSAPTGANNTTGLTGNNATESNRPLLTITYTLPEGGMFFMSV